MTITWLLSRLDSDLRADVDADKGSTTEQRLEITPFMLVHLIAVALVIGTIAVPVYLGRFVYRLVKKPATRR